MEVVHDEAVGQVVNVIINLNMVEHYKIVLADITSTEEIFVDPSLRHGLPSDRIKSRLSHAKIWELYGIKKDTIRTLIILSRNSRAFVLTQRLTLDGFLIDYHVCIASWFFEFQFYTQFSSRIADEIHEPAQVSEVLPLLAKL